MLRSALSVSVLCVCVCSTPALAAPDRVTQLKEEAYKAFEVGRYGQAIRAMEEAYKLQRDPRLLYNLGLFYHKRFELKSARPDLVQARDLFKRFLALVPVSLARSAAERRKLIDVRRLAREYLRSIKRRAAATATPRAPVSRPAPQTRESSTPTASASSTRRDPPTGRDALFDGWSPAVKVTKKRRGRRSKRTWPWVLYGVGAAALTAAAVTGGMAVHSANEAESAASRGDVGENHRYVDRTDALAVSTDVFIGCAVAAVAAGVVVHLLGAKRRARVAWSPGGTLLSVNY